MNTVKMAWISMMFALSAQCFGSLFLQKEVQELFTLTGLTYKADLAYVVEQTQKAWLRQPGKERWEMQSSPLSREDQNQARSLFDAIGFFNEQQPSRMHYDACCILGASLPSVQKRLDYAIKLWNSGVRFKTLIFLTGDRTLDPQADSGTILETLPTHETAGMIALYEKMQIPSEMRALPLIIIDIPKQKAPDGTLRRPTTADTIKGLVERSLNATTYLFISHQPYVKYQDLIIKSIMPAGTSYDVAGPHIDQDERTNIAVLLDTVARCLYTEKQIMIQTKK